MATKNVINKTKFSQVTATPETLAVGEQAYSTASGSLFIGDATGTPVKIGGVTDVTKLAGIEAGAQVNTVTSVNGHTGAAVVTAADVGLGNVTNESKSTMFTNATFTGTTSGIAKGMVGLGNVDNTTDADKPISTATSTALALKAPLANPNFTGEVTGVTKAMVGLGNADNTSDANKPISSATQTALNLKATVNAPTFTGDVTLANSTPTNALHAASKGYVDTMSMGITVKDAVRVATVAPITLSGEQTIDGVAVVTGDRVLVKDQADLTTNGIYVAASGAWARSADADNNPGGINSEMRNGMFVLVNEGTTLHDTQWTLQTSEAVDVGTTDLVFTKFSSQISYTAGNGLTLSGTTFTIDNAVTLSTSSTLDVTKFSNGTAAAFNGSAITALNATALSTGTVADARLSANVIMSGDTLDGGSF